VTNLISVKLSNLFYVTFVVYIAGSAETTYMLPVVSRVRAEEGCSTPFLPSGDPVRGPIVLGPARPVRSLGIAVPLRPSGLPAIPELALAGLWSVYLRSLGTSGCAWRVRTCWLSSSVAHALVCM